ncbi:MAG: hypothetical protein UT94_C0024G0014 [Candidatus Uhrbacteria bacterium GW2011_GWF2_40_263]|nr:MAG: hypothetical protein UT94_C0024G0014 [Candidatus Uhrbacteria bacterium GW2011_GWF2_40_263]
MKYYAVFDKQVGEYTDTGYNYTSRDAVRTDMLSYIEYDIEGQDREAILKMSLEEMLDVWDFRLDEQDKPFPAYKY